MIIAQETWLPVVGYEGFYEVSSFGRVRSVDRYERAHGIHMRFRRGQIIKPYEMPDGYLRTKLRKNGAPQKKIGVHRVVAMAFVPNPDNLQIVNHIDHDKQNNNADNLEWVTNRGNQIAYRDRNKRQLKIRFDINESQQQLTLL